MFHGRAHQGQVHLEGMQLDAPEHADAQNAKAFAYVRPHDLDVQRYSPGAQGIVVQLNRAIVVGPIARLELIPADDTQPGNPSGKDRSSRRRFLRNNSGTWGSRRARRWW
jgi:sulfate transport system ATP-binding protein